MFLTGLSGSAAKKQAKALARSRADMLRGNDRKALEALRVRIADARARRRVALRRAVGLCQRGRDSVRAEVKAFRVRERERINREISELRGRARSACSARKARIRKAGGSLVERERRALDEERRLQAQLRRLATAQRRKVARLSTAKERRQEDDDTVRGNLPPELAGVFDRVKRSIKAGPRTTRTEAFLEWAQENPDDVLRHQQDDTDREVARLVAEHEQLSKQLRKTSGYRVPKAELRKLERMGAARSPVEARRVAGSDLDWVPF